MKSILISFCLVALSVPAHASDAPATPKVADAVQARAKKRAELATELHSPAREVPTKACVDRAITASSEDASLVVQALHVARGPHAVDGLMRLTRHRGHDVSMAAWGAIAMLAMRRDDVAELAKREVLITSEPKESERIAAALGRVGDARHLPALFEIAASENEAQRKAAFAGMRALSGVHLPDRLSHWLSWWRLRKRRGNVDLRAALGAIESQRTTNVSLQVRIVVRDAWFDLPLAREALRTWLRIHDPRLRVHAAKLVAELRLGDLIEELDSMGRYSDDVEERQAAATALRDLDVPLSAWREQLASKEG